MSADDANVSRVNDEAHALDPETSETEEAREEERSYADFTETQSDHRVSSSSEPNSAVLDSITVDAEIMPDPESVVESNLPKGVASAVGGIAIGQISGDVVIARADRFGDEHAMFANSLRHRDEFVSSFLRQALQQSNMTFFLSIFFTTIGGLVVLGAAILAITRFAGSPSHAIALVSGIAGILISTSGGAFSLRADRARKHLARQAEIMHSQLLDERRFTQVIDLLAGIKDPQLSDQTRMSMILRLMGDTDTGKVLQTSPEKPQRPRRRRHN